MTTPDTLAPEASGPRHPLRLALWQQPGLCGQPDAMLDRLAALLASGTLAEVDLLLLPELWTSGYLDADAVTAASEPADGPWQQRIAALARDHGIAIAHGYPELAQGKRYNTARLIDAQGETLWSYRKVNLWADYERALFAPGDSPSAIATLHGWRIGASICYDTEYPETVRDLALRGADLVLAPAAVGAEFALVAEAVIRVRALENGLWLAFANRSGSEHGYPFDGQSAIVGPDGVVRARATTDEALLLVTLDHAATQAARATGPYLSDMRWAPPRL
ncbi:nitrilase-related carbon-nitrogen hydrolase [Novosphingobium sp.]|uniref:nitrilase-related carbon-nitrogen hydrolase n=1 Tax=Novosphingobium sp. TaxID=1874826 RepID=UPI003341C3B8